MKVGDVCVKVAGRDAGKVCVVIDVLENNRVLVDGESRRRKVNPSHLVLLGKQAKVERGASHEKALEAIKGAKEIEPAKIADKKPGVKEVGKAEDAEIKEKGIEESKGTKEKLEKKDVKKPLEKKEEKSGKRPIKKKASKK